MAIWLINYQIESDDREDYRDWFENVHIPEKLDRSGYDWAAHYRVLNDDRQNDVTEYIAMFGSESTRTFYDPSPAQLKPTQTELTREMIAFRKQAKTSIMSEEWRQSGKEGDDRNNLAIQYPTIQLSDYQIDDEQSLNAWMAQEKLNGLLEQKGVESVGKFIGSSGHHRQCLIVGYSSEVADIQQFENEMIDTELVNANHKIAICDWPSV